MCVREKESLCRKTEHVPYRVGVKERETVCVSVCVCVCVCVCVRACLRASEYVLT